MKNWAITSGTVFGLGYAPFASGTVASVAATAVYWAVGGWSPLVSLVLVVALTVLGVQAAPAMERRFGPDPSEFVLDEVVGVLIALALVPQPASWTWCFTALVLFRVFDIWKPGPVGRLDKIHGGVGVMGDDVVAGIGAAIILVLGRLFFA